MGADMIVSGMWFDGEPKVEQAKAAIAEAIRTEPYAHVLEAAADFMLIELYDDEHMGELIEAVAANEGVTSQARARLVSNYHDLLDEFAATLDSREVAWWSYGSVRLYLTGGMSWGDSPSEAMDVWDRVFWDEENPYAHLLRVAMGLCTASDRPEHAGQPVVEISVTPPAASPFIRPAA